MISHSQLRHIRYEEIERFEAFYKGFSGQEKGFSLVLFEQGKSSEIQKVVDTSDKLSISQTGIDVFLITNDFHKRMFLVSIDETIPSIGKEDVRFHLRWAMEKLGEKISGIEETPTSIYIANSSSTLQRRIVKDLCFKLLPKGLEVFSAADEVLDLGQVFYSDSDFSPEVFKTELFQEASFRRWVNENPEVLTSIEIGHRMQAFADAHHFKYEKLETEEIRKKGLELLYRVGRASNDSPPRLHMLEIRKTDDKRAPLLLVGKGITFDTGGINIKAFENHVGCMKNDMGGAALMYHLAASLVEGGYDYPVVLAIPACENSIDANAMKPGSIYRSYSGKTVKVEHTDAEGRLILADAISYCEEKYKPVKTMVAATLTTAALRQFSGYQTPVHFADQKFKSKLAEKASEVGELFCHQSYLPAYAQGNHDSVADLTNMGRLPSVASMGGGSNIAAHFLKEFSESPSFMHIDIFASTWNWSGDYPGAAAGATGACLESLSKTILELGQDWFNE